MSNDSYQSKPAEICICKKKIAEHFKETFSQNRIANSLFPSSHFKNIYNINPRKIRGTPSQYATTTVNISEHTSS